MKILSILTKPEIITEQDNLNICLISDIHAGGDESILSPGSKNRKGEIIPLTVQQEILYKNFMEHINNTPKQDILFLNGDLVDGRNTMNAGLSMRTTNTSVQVNMAVEICKQVIKILDPKIIIGAKGSGYHIQDGGFDLDKAVVDKLEREFTDKKFFYCEPKAIFKLGKRWWYLVHELPGSPFSFLPNSMYNIYKQHIIESERACSQKADTLCFAHQHRVVAPIELVHKHNPNIASVYAMASPCLKITDDYLEKGAKISYPDLGYMTVEQSGLDIIGHKIHLIYNEWSKCEPD